MPKRLLRPLVFTSGLIASASTAQTQTEINAFQFFEFVLTPIAIKWACGGQRNQDLAALDAMIAANPKDAREAELPEIIEILKDLSMREDGITELLGFETSDQQKERLCAAVLPLSLGAIPMDGSPGQTDENFVSEQELKWAAFREVLEDLLAETSP